MIRISALAFIFIIAAMSCTAFAQSQNGPPSAGNPYNLSGEDLKNFKAVTPSQQAGLAAQAKQQWQSMGAEKQQAMKQQVLDQLNSMSPAQRQALAQQTLQQWQAMTPKEQQELKDTFPDLLHGDLELDTH